MSTKILELWDEVTCVRYQLACRLTHFLVISLTISCNMCCSAFGQAGEASLNMKTHFMMLGGLQANAKNKKNMENKKRYKRHFKTLESVFFQTVFSDPGIFSKRPGT